jgi:hypothetical protein
LILAGTIVYATGITAVTLNEILRKRPTRQDEYLIGVEANSSPSIMETLLEPGPEVEVDGQDHESGRGQITIYRGPAPDTTSGGGNVYLLDNQPIIVTNHRRVRQRLHRQLAYKLAEATKLRFGCPVRDAANYRAVRKYIFDQIQARGINNYDASLAIDRAVELVFVPTEEERFAAGIPRCEVARRWNYEFHHGHTSSGCDFLCFNWRWNTRSVPRIPRC